MLYTLLIVLLVLALLGALPTWNYSSQWGWSPVTVIVVILIVLLVLGRQ